MPNDYNDYIDGCPCSACTAIRAAAENHTKPPVNPVNAQALTEIIPVLRQLDAQERFEMRTWANGIVNPNAADYTECGTQFCMAGAKAVVDGWRPQYEIGCTYDVKQRKYVAVTRATGKFVRPENRHITDMDSPLAHQAFNIAAEAFALDAQQAEFLFHGTHISRVADLVRRIQWLIDGERASEYPSALVELEQLHGAEDSETRRAARSRALQPAAAQ